ncbi:hypothetical protein IB277_31165 [Ensifer sp. ENS07]|uniref:hypothetical protein n=1 Tax=Ensifer sp. ENS07 TaxID=2769274 RepID=UPI0017803548|nr:hypothetical protein [Ensifer sp. ENS07]MBD9640760.1 hypothetical protein [Ensifer sp. ENS07]
MTSVHLLQATVAASAAIAECSAAAELLARAMERAHGGSWRIQIDHEDEVAIVARRHHRGPLTPKPEVA